MPAPSAAPNADGMAAAILQRVRSDKDFQTELTRIAATLSDKDNWDRRVEALLELRALLELDISRFEACVPAMSQIIKIPLEAQITDLRSAVVKEACACVRAMAHSAGSGAAEAFSDWYIKELYNASCATIAVIAQSADETLRTIAGSGRVNRNALMAFFAGCGAKHAVVRRNAFHYLLMLLTSVEPPVLQRHAPTIEKILRAGVADAIPDARKMCRLALWAFERICPKQAHELLEGLESAVKRAVEKEQDAFEEWLQSGDAALAAPAAAGRVTRGPTAGGAAATPATARKRPSGVALGGATPTPGGTPAASASSPADQHLAAAAGGAGARLTASSRHGSAASMGAHATRPAATPGGAARSRAASHDDRAAAAPSPAQPGRATGGSAHDAVAAARARVAARAKSSDRTSHPPVPPPAAAAAAAADMDATPAKRPATAVGMKRFASATRASPANRKLQEHESGPNDDAWYGALDGAQSSDWLTRMRSFDSITEYVATGTLSLVRASDCVPLVVQHLSDTHYRVVLAVMQVCDTMVDKVPDVLAPSLERLLVPLFQRLTDTKKPVADKARSSLDAMRRVYGVDTLIPVLHKVLDVNNNKVRIAAIEFLSYLLAFANKYFNVAPAIRATIHRMLAIASRRPPADVHRACMSFLAKLYDRHRDLFVAQINALNPTEQQDAIEILKKAIPHVAQDCKRQLAGEKLLRHAPAAGDDADDASPGSPTSDGRGGSGPRGPTTAVGPRPVFGDHRDAADRALNGRRSARHADPLANGADRNAAAAAMASLGPDGVAAAAAGSPRRGDERDAGDQTVVIPASPIAQWRAERAMPREIAGLRAAVSVEEKRAALREAHAALSSNVGVWRDNFLRLLAFPLSFTADQSNHALRLAALQLVRALLAVPVLRDQAAQQHEAMLRSAVACLDDPFAEVQAEAVTLYREVGAHFDPAAVLQAQIRIAEALLPMNARCLEFVLRELAAPFRRAADRGEPLPDGGAVIKLLPELIDVITVAFGHHSSDIRKTAVLDLVDMYFALGDALLPRLAHLTHSQLKLISIYVVRAGRNGSEGLDLATRMVDLGIIQPRF